MFFGSAGAIDAADLVGQIVAPTVVVNNEYLNPDRLGGKLAHVIRNRAAAFVPVKTAHVSVENMVLETTNWAAAKKKNRILTVDQELYHFVDAVNTSPYGGKIRLYVGILITDNVSTAPSPHASTLQYAEDVIAQTSTTRRLFLAKILAEAGIIRDRSVATRSDTNIDERRNSAVSGR
ncbi:MAG TPA: hypothetical protein VNT76_02265 [Candidatus Binatus sp.]|nr:hypothetical protein [Candidatus Binatus sp.]